MSRYLCCCSRYFTGRGWGGECQPEVRNSAEAQQSRNPPRLTGRTRKAQIFAQLSSPLSGPPARNCRPANTCPGIWQRTAVTEMFARFEISRGNIFCLDSTPRDKQSPSRSTQGLRLAFYSEVISRLGNRLTGSEISAVYRQIGERFEIKKSFNIRNLSEIHSVFSAGKRKGGI